MNENLVYILHCANHSYYTGWTNCFLKRMKAHQKGTACAYTRAFQPVEILYIECLSTKSEALKREAEIKKLTRQKKQLLIEKHAPSTKEYLLSHPFQFQEE